MDNANKIFIQRTPIITPNSTPKPVQRPTTGTSFQDILNQKISENTELKWSKHAENRLKERGITLTDEQMGKLKQAVEKADNKGVKVLIETNGVLANSENMLRLMKTVDNPNAGVLWDIHHPYRFMNEAVSDTYNALKDYIEFVHIKDSKLQDGKVYYKMMGYGDVPVTEALTQ
jgi:flagellar operon protein